MKMKLSTVSLAFVFVACCACLPASVLSDRTDGDHRALFSSWIDQHSKVYASAEEYNSAFETFVQRVALVDAHNSREDNSFLMSLNEFADRVPSDVVSLPTPSIDADSTPASVSSSGLRLPQDFSWVPKAVTPVQNQGECGSSLLFGSLAAVEGIWAVETGKLVEFSVQQVLDCGGFPSGCNGGLPGQLYSYAMKNGLCSADDYPSGGHAGECHHCHPVLPPGWLGPEVNVSQSDSALMKAVYSSPVSAIVCVNQAFEMYTSGIFDAPCDCEPNHGVAIVGFGTDNGMDYWLLKNSWGTSWGEQGYMRLARKPDQPHGQCGIESYARLPTHA